MDLEEEEDIPRPIGCTPWRGKCGIQGTRCHHLRPMACSEVDACRTCFFLAQACSGARASSGELLWDAPASMAWPGTEKYAQCCGYALGLHGGRGQAVEVPFAACGLDLYIALAGVCMLLGLLAGWVLHASM